MGSCIYVGKAICMPARRYRPERVYGCLWSFPTSNKIKNICENKANATNFTHMRMWVHNGSTSKYKKKNNNNHISWQLHTLPHPSDPFEWWMHYFGHVFALDLILNGSIYCNDFRVGVRICGAVGPSFSIFFASGSANTERECCTV